MTVPQATRTDGTPSRVATEDCVHCAQPLFDQTFAPFCCRGCRTVHGILKRSGLSRYYDLRRGPGLPPADATPPETDPKWLEGIEEARAQTGSSRIALDVQGIHCAACVWVIEELFRRHGGSQLGTILVNPTLGRIDLQVTRRFDLHNWLRAVAELGYVVGPAEGIPEERPSNDLLVRMGICVALAANVMLFAAATYVGLGEGPVYELLNDLSYAAGVVSVWVGGSVFIRSAVSALQVRMLHLDVPIALGVVLAFAGSSWAFFVESGDAAYVDTLTVFIALMLVGRWLQQRILERNQARLLTDDGTEGLLTRSVSNGRVRIVPCVSLQEGDELLIAPGDLVPVNLTLTESSASCSLDWIDGESVPRAFEIGDEVPAGAFNAGERAFRGKAATDFSDSTIVRLLETEVPRAASGPPATTWWRRVSTYYVIGVLLLATTATVVWSLIDGPLRAIEVATAVLVVTCPCAFGIAAPLAYELVSYGLRRAGVFVRTRDLFDRAARIQHVAFDKTGTLTTGTLTARNRSTLSRLNATDTEVLYNMAARSAHPKSAAVRRALEGDPAAQLRSLAVDEVLGRGLSATKGTHAYRLGAPEWADPGSSTQEADVVFARDGEAIAVIQTIEELRPDARDEVERLRREGYDLAILSGDGAVAVEAVGRRLGLDASVCLGNLSPEDKARYVDTHEPARTLLVGDGLNDRVAMDVAACSGTPAVNRPFMASRCDFYFLSPGLRPIAQILRGSRVVTQLVRRLLLFAVAYNVVTVSIAMAGQMEPWIAAVLMPLSSLVTLGYAMTALSKEPWRS
ncbi:MAG: heavy metal translocating P-type ATPase metal-binding domain-containing protein [Myxococcota bacterium]